MQDARSEPAGADREIEGERQRDRDGVVGGVLGQASADREVEEQALPSGSSAAPCTLAFCPLSAITARALASFPAITHIIMVGIAGACPNPDKPAEHVRLGDIIVPDHHGIIEYDDVKQSEGGHIKIRGKPQLPAQQMLGADNRLFQLDARGKRPWEAHIQKGLKKLPHYARPDDATDILHGANGEPIPHPHDPKRRPRQPRVHRGAIASADTLLKPIFDSWGRREGVKAADFLGSGVDRAQNVVPRRK